MKPNQKAYKGIKIFIALVWLTNGLICKVFNLVPRHHEIVAEILGNDHSQLLTILIGTAEIIMALWILSDFQSRINSIIQIIVVGTMNIIEFILVPHLLLFDRLNAIFALIFIGLIYFNEFILIRPIKE